MGQEVTTAPRSRTGIRRIGQRYVTGALRQEGGRERQGLPPHNPQHGQRCQLLCTLQVPWSQRGALQPAWPGCDYDPSMSWPAITTLHLWAARGNSGQNHPWKGQR